VDPSPIRFDAPAFDDALSTRFDADVAEVVRLSARLCAIPGITVPDATADMDAVLRTHALAADQARAYGLRVREFEPDEAHPYPFLLVSFAEHDPTDPDFTEAIGFIGHVDVVPPREEDQFSPVLKGVDLYARGAADMKTVVATWLVWMARQQARPGPRPPVLLMLSSCEENGSARLHHSEAVLEWLAENGVQVRFSIVGERTGELEWMPADTPIGPICCENRSWRWVRAEHEDGGLAALHGMAAVVQAGRERVHALNTEHVPAEKAARQPGVRSGLVCSFALAGSDADLPQGGVWFEVVRPAGKAIHAAAAKASALSLIERLAAVATQAASEFKQVHLGELRIGADGNFNSTDGSGRVKLVVSATPDAVDAWLSSLDLGELQVARCAAEVADGPALLGLDIRELLDHSEAVGALVARLPEQLPGWGVQFTNYRPAWACPADQPDLVALQSAWKEVVGTSSPTLVKLHGNDGGSVAALEEKREGATLGEAPVVVFGQVGMRPHGAGEFHRCTSIRPYWEVLDRWLGSAG
jgi:acetylornithine deacetylase/succinyl-diaminopimelate desuccinylase-like protein